MIGISPGENLRLILQAAESASVDNAIAVAFVIVAVGVRRLRVAPALRLFHRHGVGCELATILVAHRSSRAASWKVNIAQGPGNAKTGQGHCAASALGHPMVPARGTSKSLMSRAAMAMQASPAKRSLTQVLRVGVRDTVHPPRTLTEPHGPSREPLALAPPLV